MMNRSGTSGCVGMHVGEVGDSQSLQLKDNTSFGTLSFS